jgi:hypothetical protein
LLLAFSKIDKKRIKPKNLHEKKLKKKLAAARRKQHKQEEDELVETERLRIELE